MYVSAEIIATLSSFITLGIAMFALVASLVRRIDRVENKVDALEDKLGGRLDSLTGEVTEVKIAVARLEGPPRHLLPVR